MRQIIPNDDLLQQTLRETRTLAIQNARYSLKNFLLEEKLPLDDLAKTDNIDELVDKILKRSKEDSDDYDLKGDLISTVNTNFAKNQLRMTLTSVTDIQMARKNLS